MLSNGLETRPGAPWKRLLLRALLETPVQHASLSATSGVLTIDFRLGTSLNIPLTANLSSIVLRGVVPGKVQSMLLVFTADGTQRTGLAAAWLPIIFPSNTPPIFTLTTNKRDAISIANPDAGSPFLGFVGGQNF